MAFARAAQLHLLVTSLHQTPRSPAHAQAAAPRGSAPAVTDEAAIPADHITRRRTVSGRTRTSRFLNL